MKKVNKILIPLISLSLIAGIFYYLSLNSKDLLRLTQVKPSLFLYFTIIYFLHYFFISNAQTAPYFKENIFLTNREKMGISILGDFFSYFLPAKGGTFVRMLYLKTKHQLSCRSFLAMGFTTVATGYSALGIVGSLYIYNVSFDSKLTKALEAIFLAMSLSGIFLVFFTSTAAKVFKVKRNLSPIKYIQDKKIILKIVFFYFLYFSLTPLKLILSFQTIGIELNSMQALNMSLLLIIVSFFPILPGNIGIKELATAYIANEYGISTEMALVASLIDRAFSILFILPSGIYFYWDLILNRNLKSHSLRTMFSSKQIDT